MARVKCPSKTGGRRSLYRATLVSIARAGLDARGNVRYRLTVTARNLSGEAIEATVTTRGYVRDDVEALGAGDLINVIRDGNGSAIHIEKTGD